MKKTVPSRLTVIARKAVIVFLAALGFTSFVVFADIYTYRDENGIAHFTNCPGLDSRYKRVYRIPTGNEAPSNLESADNSPLGAANSKCSAEDLAKLKMQQNSGVQPARSSQPPHTQTDSKINDVQQLPTPKGKFKPTLIAIGHIIRDFPLAVHF